MKALSIIIAMAISCTAPRTHEPVKPAPQSAELQSKSAQNESFDPSILETRWNIVSHKKPAAIKPYNDSADNDPIASRSVSPEMNRLGFRVQLTSTPNYYEALQVRDSAGVHLSGEIYLDYEPPYYKVRIGNYVLREHADTMTSISRKAGFHDAWVVRTNVLNRN